MKKFFTLIAAVLFAGSMMAEGLLFEQTYPGNPDTITNAYTKVFTITTNGYTLTYANINNGQNASSNWDAIRCGRKNDASVATISSAAIAEKVSKVLVEFSQAKPNKTNKLALLVADNAEFSNATEIEKTIAVGEITFEVAEPAENKFYRISLDMAADGSENGFNRIAKIQFISPDGGTPIVPEVYDTISVAEAKAICDTLADNASSEKKYYVEGFAVNVEKYSAEYSNQTFFLVDSVNAPDSLFQAYRAVPEKDDAAYPVLAGDKLRLFGKLKKYVDTKNGNKVQLEIATPTVEFLEEVPGDRSIDTVPGPEPLPEGVISCDSALVLAAAIADPTEVKGTVEGPAVVVRGYVAYKYDASDGKQSAWIGDTKGKSTLQGSYLQITSVVAVNDYVQLSGTLAKYLREGKDGKPNEVVIEVINGTMYKVAELGIEEVVMTEKATKVIVDGVMYIVRDNKMYNLQGTQVR